MTTRKTAVVVGATGVSGRNMVQYLEGRDEWRVIGLSRRVPDYGGGARFVQVDLLDAADCAAKLSDLSETTHVFYCAFHGQGTWAEQVAPNLAILVNAVSALERAAPGSTPSLRAA